MLILAGVFVVTSGCANLNSVYRSHATVSGNADTILIDAKQRPITINRTTDPPQTCVARSPDAISQAAASGNLKITQKSGSGGELGFATAEQVSSIAFRTQVTEAQQEFLYYLCQLSSNGKLNEDEVSDNLRHFQNTMLALVAVDDLATSSRTKPAPPGQGGNTNPPAPPDPSDPKVQAFKAAQSGADTAKNGVKSAGEQVDAKAKAVAAVADVGALKPPTDELSAALKTYDSKQKAYADALTSLQKAIQAQKGKDAKVPDDVTTASGNATNERKDVDATFAKTNDSVAALAKTTDNAKLAAAKTDLDGNLKAHKDAVAKYEGTEDSLGKALSAWSAPSDAPDAHENRNAGNDDSNNGGVSTAVANNVAIIVQTIVWQTFVTEQCQKALFQRFSATDASVRAFCLKHLELADSVREKQLMAQLPKQDQSQNAQPPVVAPVQPLQPPAVR
jgi:hypothetical protein